MELCQARFLLASCSVGEEMNGVMDGTMMMPTLMMSDEQIEVLRKQISAYAVISEGLVEMYKNTRAQQESLSGIRRGNIYFDPLLSSGQKITTRQRWAPTSMQLQILENIFGQGIGTPCRRKIKQITSLLSEHGQVSETNVYNWFQNRRARSKRKQTGGTLPPNAQSNDENEISSPRKKKALSGKINPCDTPEISSDVHLNNAMMNGGVPSSNDDTRSPGSSSQLSSLQWYLAELKN